MSEVIDRPEDATVEVEFIAFNGDPMILRIRRSPVGAHGPHDEISFHTPDGERLAHMHINDRRRVSDENLTVRQTPDEVRGWATWFPEGYASVISFEIADPMRNARGYLEFGRGSARRMVVERDT